jgi:hypothetical protein
LTLLFYAGSCKSSGSVISKVAPTLEKKCHTTLNPEKINQEAHIIAEAKEGKANDSALTSTSKPSKCEKSAGSAGKAEFSLKDIAIQAGTIQSLMLEVGGTVEGYIIKSVSVTKNTTTNYTKHFGLNTLKGQLISSPGVNFTLVADQKLKPSVYTLKIKVGRTGVGSRATEQIVCCTITVTSTKDNVKPKKEITSPKKIEPNSGGQKTKVQTANNAIHAIKEEGVNNNTIHTNLTENPTKLTQGHTEAVTEVTLLITEIRADDDFQGVASMPDQFGTLELEQPVNEVAVSAITCQFLKEGEACENIPTVRCKVKEEIIILYTIPDMADNQTNYKIQNIQMIKPGNTRSSPKKPFGLEQYKGKNKVFEKKIQFLAKEVGTFRLIVKIKRNGEKSLLISECCVEINE